MADDQSEKQKQTEAPSPKTSLLKWIIITLVVVIVMVAGGLLSWNLLLKQDSKNTEGDQQIADSSSKNQNNVKILYPLESFIVNLLDKTGLGKRYLKITIELEVDNEASKNIIESNKTQLKDTILILLSGLSFEEISSIEGKLDLKQAILSRTNQVLGSNTIRRIYFTEFVVQ